MLAFVVNINGKRICTAGLGDIGLLLGIIRWCKRPDDTEEVADLEICGQILPTDEHVVWCDVPIHRGDEISIKIMDADFVDKPAKLVNLKDIVDEGTEE